MDRTEASRRARELVSRMTVEEAAGKPTVIVGKPLYPFGFGLTYSKVAVTKASCSADGANYKVYIDVQNIGKADTQDVVQVYAQNGGSSNAPLNPRLVAFRRVSLTAGEKVSVVLDVKAEDLMVVDGKGNRVREGRPVLYAGTCQPDACSRSLSGTETIELEVD